MNWWNLDAQIDSTPMVCITRTFRKVTIDNA